MAIRINPKNGLDVELNPGEARDWSLTGTQGEPVVVSIMWKAEFLAPNGGPFPGSQALPTAEPSNMPRVKIAYSVEQGGTNTIIADAWPGGGVTITATIANVSLENKEFVDSIIGVRCPVKMHVNAILGPLNGRKPLRYTKTFFVPPDVETIEASANVPAYSSNVRSYGCNFGGTITTCSGIDGYGRPMVQRLFLPLQEQILPITTPGNCLSVRINSPLSPDPSIGGMGSFVFELNP